MSDPLRTDTARAQNGGSESDRDAKIEQLLLVGLDHYFASEYEQAINVWTRALFFDRSHPRARAYIERARNALAEHQRESEELLHHGVAAFNRGESDEARRLLHAAMKRGAPRDEVLAMLDRLNRLAQGSAPHVPGPVVRSERSNPAAQTDRGRPVARLGLLFLVAVMLLVAAGFIIATSAPIDWRSILALHAARAPATAIPAATGAALPLPRRGETALARARALVTSGHLREALSALELVRPTDAQKAEADRLRADIQQQLVALARAPASETPRGAADSATGQPSRP